MYADNANLLDSVSVPSAQSAGRSTLDEDNALHHRFRLCHIRRILFFEHAFSSQRARSSKEVTEADAFLCDLDPSLWAL
jgi:hypothetical protein